MFPGAGRDQARANQSQRRPYGTVHQILGMASCSLHSRAGRKAGDLRLNKTVFHPGWVLTGKVPDHGSSGLDIHTHINGAVLCHKQRPRHSMTHGGLVEA